MPTLSFTLLPPAIACLHEALSCLAKFDEAIFLEAFPTHIQLSTLNTSKTAYATFNFDAFTFFDSFHHDPDSDGLRSGPQGCHFLSKALLSVFKRRHAEVRDKQSSVERCEVQLFSGPEETECRLLVKMFCKSSVVYTYRLIYEGVEVMHAKYDENSTRNHWTLEPKVVRDIVEYFGPRTEQLDWSYGNDKVTFTSYTEKVQYGKEILKQPMHTSVAIERKDFNSFDVQEGLHIGIIVKDFRAIVDLSDALRTSVTARYSRENRPLQFALGVEGMQCQFTLMTRGYSDVPETTSRRETPARDLSLRPSSRPPQPARTESRPAQNESSMPPPPRRPATSKVAPLGRTNIPPSTNESTARPTPSASLDPNSLFLPGNDDEAWDEPNYAPEEDDVDWDASLNRDSFLSDPSRRLRDGDFPPTQPSRQVEDHPGIAPTQRLSEVHGLFD